MFMKENFKKIPYLDKGFLQANMEIVILALGRIINVKAMDKKLVKIINILENFIMVK